MMEVMKLAWMLRDAAGFDRAAICHVDGADVVGDFLLGFVYKFHFVSLL